MTSKNCPICLGEHDEEIHAATVRLREWLRARVTRNLVELEQPVATPEAA